MDEIFGLPIHPLLVHAPVVAVPTLIIAAVVYVLIPRTRRTIGWVVMVLSVIAPLSVLAGWWSGHQFYDLHIEMIAGAGAPTDKFESLLAAHLAYGDIVIWLVPALSVAIWLFGAMHRGRLLAPRPAPVATDTDTESDAADPAESADDAAVPAANGTNAPGRRLVMAALAVVIIGLSATSGWYTIQSGHSGAQVVWGNEKQ